LKGRNQPRRTQRYTKAPSFSVFLRVPLRPSWFICSGFRQTAPLPSEGCRFGFTGRYTKIGFCALEKSDEQIGSQFILVALPSDAFPFARRL
jgi:hypothetical protein